MNMNKMSAVLRVLSAMPRSGSSGRIFESTPATLALRCRGGSTAGFSGHSRASFGFTESLASNVPRTRGAALWSLGMVVGGAVVLLQFEELNGGGSRRVLCKPTMHRENMPFPDFPAVGGHGGMLKDSPDTVLKPVLPDVRGAREVAFYRRQQRAHEIPSDLIPGFHGVVVVNRATVKAVDGEAEMSPDGPSEGAPPPQSFLRLEDLTAKFAAPCVCDVKLGTITWGPEASAEKVARIRRKYPHQETLGFRFTGMRVYKPSDHAFVQHDRAFGASLDPKSMERGVEEFLHDGHTVRAELIPAILSRLRRLRAWVTGKGRHYRLLNTSVLLVYEGDPAVRSRAQRPAVDVKLIDFAHSSRVGFSGWDDDSGRASTDVEPDASFLTGLDGLIAAMEHTGRKHGLSL